MADRHPSPMSQEERFPCKRVVASCLDLWQLAGRHRSLSRRLRCFSVVWPVKILVSAKRPHSNFFHLGDRHEPEEHRHRFPSRLYN